MKSSTNAPSQQAHKTHSSVSNNSASTPPIDMAQQQNHLVDTQVGTQPQRLGTTTAECGPSDKRFYSFFSFRENRKEGSLQQQQQQSLNYSPRSYDNTSTTASTSFIADQQYGDTTPHSNNTASPRFLIHNYSSPSSTTVAAVSSPSSSVASRQNSTSISNQNEDQLSTKRAGIGFASHWKITKQQRSTRTKRSKNTRLPPSNDNFIHYDTNNISNNNTSSNHFKGVEGNNTRSNPSLYNNRITGGVDGDSVSTTTTSIYSRPVVEHSSTPNSTQGYQSQQQQHESQQGYIYAAKDRSNPTLNSPQQQLDPSLVQSPSPASSTTTFNEDELYQRMYEECFRKLDSTNSFHNISYAVSDTTTTSSTTTTTDTVSVPSLEDTSHQVVSKSRRERTQLKIKDLLS